MGGLLKKMINEILKNNWLKILDSNAKIGTKGGSKKSFDHVRIPLTPVKINPNVLYHLFEILYPKFINDQKNILDVIISDDGQSVLGLYLYETKDIGIHDAIRKISADIIKIQEGNLISIEMLFKKLQSALLNKTGLRISSIRVFKKKAIDLLNKHCINMEEISFNEFLDKFLDLIQVLFEQGLFYIYPEPNIYRFVKESLIFLNKIKLTKIFSFIDDFLPASHHSFVTRSDNQILILNLKKAMNSSERSNYYFKILSHEDLGVKNKNLGVKELLITINKYLKSDKIFFLNRDQVISFLLDLFELKVPLDNQDLQLFLQKMIYGYRSFENNWYSSPRPRIYNNLVRYLIRTFFGINFNLKKLSHWAISDFIFNSFRSFLGLNFKILVLYTDIKSFKRINLKNNDYLRKTLKTAFLIEIENEKIVKIFPVIKEDIIPENATVTLDSIKVKASSHHGDISAVIRVDKYILNSFIKNYVFKLSSCNLLNKVRALNNLKKKHYFNVFPEIPLFKLLKTRGSLSLFKIIMRIAIDKHEF